MSSFKKVNGFSRDINHVWFERCTKYFENNPQNHFSCALIRFRNLSLLAHLVRLLFVATSLVFFSVFRFHRELLIAFGIDEAIIIVGFYSILKINEFLLKTYRYLLIGNFLFKVIMVWADLFSSLILSIIFQWKAEIFEFIILQVVFLIFDVAPAYSIFLLYQNEIGNCKVESHHLIAEMSKTQEYEKDIESSSTAHSKESPTPTVFDGKKDESSRQNVLNYNDKAPQKLEINEIK